MAKIQAFSSVMVTDYSDVGNLSLYLTSNQPTTVVYDPDSNSYTPNWTTSPYLVITPVVAFNGTAVSLTVSGLSVTFKRKEGSGTEVALTSGETVSGNKLTVKANKLANITSKLLTYTCEVTYTDPDTNVPLTSKATLTYTLLSNPSQSKYITISGESTFLYDTNRTLVGSNTITLTANPVGVSITEWQYKNASGSWVKYPTGVNTSVTGETLIISPTEVSAMWVDDKYATIKIVTSESTVYDIHNIVKIYDGAAGNSTVSAVLSNENHYLPTTSNGTVRSWTGAETNIKIYEGGTDVTSSWTITITKGTGLNGTFSSNIFTPNSLTVDSSYVDFTCTRSGYANIIKRYTITKQYAGNDGSDAIVYTVAPSVLVMNLSEEKVFSPTSVTFYAYSKIGTADKTSYSGRFKIFESTNGTTFDTTAKYTSSANEPSKAWTPSANTIRAIKCILYEAGGTTTVLDEQTVMVTLDGKTGQDGDDGKNGISLGLTNYQDVIPCSSGGTASAAVTLNIPFYAFSGITRVPVTANVGQLPGGVTIKSNTAGTVSAAGLLVLKVPSGENFGGTSATYNSGTITITLTATVNSESQSTEEKYTWTKARNGSNGADAIILQLYSPDGGTIYNGTGSTTINTLLIKGASPVTSDITYKWYKYDEGYVIINGQTSSSLAVTANMVDGTAWFKCEATYSNKTYSAYWTVNDVSDPVLSYTYATVSEFRNGQGCGAIYTRVYRNGEELDPIKTLVFSETAPTSPSTGDFYYHLDKTNQTCVLKKYSGSAWANATEKDTLIYKYYRVDGNGAELDASGSPYKSTRVFYVDPSIINGQMQFRCSVSDS